MARALTLDFVMDEERETKDNLLRCIYHHTVFFKDTALLFRLFPLASSKKVPLNKFAKLMSEIIKTYAVLTKLVWASHNPGAIEDNIRGYFDMLEVFYVLSNGSTVGAGDTLYWLIRGIVNQVLTASIDLMRECVVAYGDEDEGEKISLIQNLLHVVFASCFALEKTPSTNVAATVLALTDIAVSVKLVIHDMEVLKPASSDRTDKASTTEESQPQPCLDDGWSEDNQIPGTELSPEEMRITKLSIGVASEILRVIKELMHSISGLRNQDLIDTFKKSLQKILNFSEEISTQIEKLAHCLYTPQNIDGLNAALLVIFHHAYYIQKETESIRGNTPLFIRACNRLKIAITVLETELKMKLEAGREGD